MKLTVPFFRGQQPVLGNTKLPEGAASATVNARVTTGDLSAFYDIGNPFTLSKAAPIQAEFLIKDKWLQYSVSENTYGSGIDISPGIIPNDTTYRTFITGTLTGPQQTNYFYATDTSQQGSNVLGAYPYVTFPVGIANPVTAPTAVSSTTIPTATPYEYAQPVLVNSVSISAAGTGYVVGDILTLAGGTLVTGLPAATINVTAINGTGGITGITLRTGGFYTTGPTGTQSGTGGTGTGATFTTIVLQTQSYTNLSPQTYDNGAGSYAHWTVSGNYLELASGQGDLTVCYTTAAFSLSTASSFTMSVDGQMVSGTGKQDLVFYLPGTPAQNGAASGLGAFLNLSGAAIVLTADSSHPDGTFVLYQSISGTNSGPVSGTVISTASPSVSYNTLYRVAVTATASTASSSPGFNVSVTLATQAAPGSILATLTGFIPYAGEQLGFGGNHRGAHNDAGIADFENFYITVTQPVSGITQESSSYVYTYVTTYGSGGNAITQESGPSAPSDTITLTTNTNVTPNTLDPVTVTIPAAPTGEFITQYNIYRLAAQTNGTSVYEFVAQVGSNTSTSVTYTDTKLDSQLGAELTTTDYAPPPSDLQGITALPNGVMAGFFNNVLSLSTPNFPFSYPVGNQYTTDTTIVGIAAIDTTVLILTTAHPYTAFGSDPSQYTMSKETSVQGCVSKRSIATHKRLGVIYASGNGLCYYRGQGNLDLIKDAQGNPLFSFEQWQALNPSSILGVVHQDYYWFWYDATGIGGSKGAYLVSVPSTTGQPPGVGGGAFGIIGLDVHVTSAYVNPNGDKMYFTPDKSTYAVNGSVVNSASNVLSQWEGNTGAKRTAVWTRDNILLPRDGCFMLCQVDANDYTNLTLTLGNENGTAFNSTVSSSLPFIIAPVPGRRWLVQFTGTSTINTIALVENSNELNTDEPGGG